MNAREIIKRPLVTEKSMKIKTGDKVMVVTGHYKGTIGEVKAVSTKSNRVIVEGVNMETVAQLKGQLTQKQYRGFLK